MKDDPDHSCSSFLPAAITSGSQRKNHLSEKDNRSRAIRFILHPSSFILHPFLYKRQTLWQRWQNRVEAGLSGGLVSQNHPIKQPYKTTSSHTGSNVLRSLPPLHWLPKAIPDRVFVGFHRLFTNRGKDAMFQLLLVSAALRQGKYPRMGHRSLNNPLRSYRAEYNKACLSSSQTGPQHPPA